MRRRGVLFGLGGVVMGTGVALGQFAVDRTPPTPPAVPAAKPAAPPQPAAAPLPSFPTAPAPAVRQASYSTPAPAPVMAPRPAPAPAPDHPLYVRAEHGGWMIVVKSYTGDAAQKYAESLATDIRQTYKSPAYLFEWGRDDREKEEQRRDEVRKRLRQEYEPFLRLQEQEKAKAAQQGIEFVEESVKIPVPKYTYSTQWAVLVGGFKDMDAARKALDTVRKWPAPQNGDLLDKALVAGGGKGEGAYLNPFPNAFVVPNPAIRRDPNAAPVVDPVVVKLNEEEPYSLFQARKPWTLLVKRMMVGRQVVGNRDENRTVIEKLFSTDLTEKNLEASAKQAREMAAMLTKLQKDGRQRFPEAFVLHDRAESLVCVGQFDSVEDPALVAAYTELNAMMFEAKFENGQTKQMRMFDAITPMRVPRAQ